MATFVGPKSQMQQIYHAAQDVRNFFLNWADQNAVHLSERRDETQRFNHTNEPKKKSPACLISAPVSHECLLCVGRAASARVTRGLH